MVSDTAKQLPFLTWIRRLTAGFLIVSYLPLVWGIVHLGVVPGRYLVVALPLYGALLGLMVYALLAVKAMRKGIRLWLAVVVSALLILANIAAYVVVRITDSTLSNVQTTEATYIEYVVIARKDAAVQLADAPNVATVLSDPLYERAMQGLSRETGAEQHTRETLLEVAESVRASEVSLGAMRKASWQLLEESYKDFYDEATVLATFRVRADDSDTIDVNVSKPFVLYISGIDTYGELSTVSRSDVNMLAVVNPESRDILLVNTPRDYYVQLHGTYGTRDKLTHAGMYGVNMSRQTLQDVYGVNIPFYARINFTSLVTLIDVLGPIEVYSDYSFKNFSEGYNTLGSKEALEFARERYSFEDGDRQRGRNQQRVIEAIVAKLNQPQNAVRLQSILNAVQNSIETNMSEASLKQFVRMQLDEVQAWKVESISVDGAGDMQPTYSMGAQPLYVMQPDEHSLAEARQRIANTLDR